MAARRTPWRVSDRLWAEVEPLLPKVERRFRYPGRRRHDDRACLEGILYVLRYAVPWAELPRVDVPTLVIHGEDDQIVPVQNSARKTAQLIEGAVVKYYPGAPHGMCSTHKDQVNADLLAFIKGEQAAVA